ncbi:Nuclear pore complex protein NUP155 [Camellia lanceoleosa]|uniref:Nuclear pore complex protein NUP155 n=1 Tax=Camellia lanceoleosa TaxID=1840588 RepID=A0ACC0G0P6_9ERIC|nr:Nuclear pore complex protein NUP155 [Camellia lanceoleosa]
MLYFANYSGDADSSIVRETWARLIDQALSRGGIAEACAVLKRVGSHVYPGDRAVLPLDTLCLHLEKDALGLNLLEMTMSRALLAACKGAIEPVLNEYLRPTVINWGNFAITKFEIASPPFSAGNTL